MTMRVAICGGGVIGACLAYYLSLDGAEVTLIERHEIAGAASGKSGGFLALDWCDGSPLSALARRSFQLHEELADSLGNDWGYRRLDTYSANASARGSSGSGTDSPLLSWLKPDVVVRGQLGTTKTTAQVIPAAFTRGMIEHAVSRGAECVMGNVTDIVLDRNGTAIRGIDIDGKEMEADAVVIAMGPWSALARRWLPVPDVYGLKGHSIVLRPSAPVPAEAIFADVETEDGMSDTPEIFPRPDGTVYLCGLSSQNPLPDDPALVATASAASNQLRAIAGMLSPLLSDADTVAAQACYRPVTRDGLPVMGAMPGIEGAYIATGHSVWGILNAPASGEVLAGLILDGQARNTDLSPFDPCRFSKAGFR